MATDFEGLIPQDVARDLIAAAELESVAMRLGNVQRMPDGVESIPVVSVEPDAEWVDPKYTGRKKATTIEWTASRLEAEQLAAESLAEWEHEAGRTRIGVSNRGGCSPLPSQCSY